MPQGFTAKAIEHFKPGTVRREIPDAGSPGLYFIVQSSGKTSWAFRYRFAGKSRKLTIGSYPAIDLKKARAKAGAALAKVAEGIDPGEEKRAKKASIAPASDLVEAAAARFISQYVRRNLRPSTINEVERILNKTIVPAWSGRRLSQIRRADIHALLDDVRERGPIAANRALAWLRRLCSWAVDRGLIETNPCTGIKPPAAEGESDRVLSDEELKSVWRASDALEQPYGAFIKLLVLTGARRNEAARMCWSEVDLEAKTWTLPAARAKNKREHTIPLSDMAAGILHSVPRIEGSSFVLTVNGRNAITAFSLMKGRLDALLPDSMPAWTLHDLRRTFASGCAQLGVAVHVVEALLNHKSGSIRGVARVYNRYSYDAEKRSAAEAWARHVAAIVSSQQGGNIVEFANTRG